MDPPASLDIHETWNEEKKCMIVKHAKELAFLEDLLEKEKQDLRESSEGDLLKLKATVPPALYRQIILPMAEKSLKNDIRQIEASHQKRTIIVEKEQKAERARHEIAYHEKLKVSLAINGDTNSAAGVKGSLISQPQDADESLTCTVQHETMCGERRLIMRVQSKKRKASKSKEHSSKKPRVETFTDSHQTFVGKPLDENAHLPTRMITFDEVYQNGAAKHKDTIVEWPSDSQQWYILKCEKHEARFTKNAIPGAARHLNGRGHGFPDRNWDMAVKTLGYLVVDCNEELVKLNNQVAEESYKSGYKPPLAKTEKQSKKRDKMQKRVHKEGKKSSSSWTVKLDADLTPKKPKVRARQNSGTPTSRQNTSNSQKVITNPKTFNIYYGRWKSNSGSEDNNEIYPVMILGWDSQNGSGLKDTTLSATGLLNKSSSPPNCYIYESDKIVGWAPGYEDGGVKADSRKFPVMFFDESQTVAWLPARYLTKFPLYKRTPPSEPDHPFNAACRWIAEREGFRTWEDREKARLYPPTSRQPSISPITPIADESAKLIVHPRGCEEPEGSERYPATSHDPSADKDDSDSLFSNSDAMSISTENTEMLVEEWQKNGGEIPGDEDYSASGSDVDDTFDAEKDDWDKPSSHAIKPSGSSDRPWAFYGLRSIEDTGELKKSIEKSRESGENQLSTSVVTGMESARALTERAYSYPINPQESHESHTSSTKRPKGSHTIQRADQLVDLPLGDRAASAPQTDVGRIASPESTLAAIIHNLITTPIPELKGSNEAHVADRYIDGDRDIPPLVYEASNDVKSKTGDKIECKPYGNLQASNSKQAANIDKGRDDISAGDEMMVDKEHLAENRQATTEETIQTTQHKEEDKNESSKHKEDQLPEGGLITPSTNQTADANVPTSNQSTNNPFTDATSSPGSADFELSQCSNGVTSWVRLNEEEDCVKLFHDKDRKIMATWRSPVDVTINLTEIASFSREYIPGSDGNSVIVLNNKDGSSWKLVFGQSKESKLLAGKIQSRGFIRQLRNANPDVRCLEKV
ncbi:hypothetical protein GL218_00992 [Daldinia childiae]|uniref:uncharacterized protein n=1 Tax=Daldinia childiae TaxID=326645 RepID=UPI001446A98A|nr:uncharacterized protein GL218_00992 [Daldinia childiae]KAF3063494.1 hypothetical protein GL218_00992 [Daldinia childiae]